MPYALAISLSCPSHHVAGERGWDGVHTSSGIEQTILNSERKENDGFSSTGKFKDNCPPTRKID
jgi:hypothetical protein